MKSIILKTAIATASIIIFGTSAIADHHGYKNSSDSCNTPSHKKVKRSAWSASPNKKMGKTAWGPKSKKLHKNAGFLIIDGKKKSVTEYFRDIERNN